MNINKNEVEFFSKLIVRTPSFPMSKLHYGKDFYKQLFDDEYFCKALFLANNVVYEQAKRWVSGEELSEKKERRLKKTLNNYWTRIHATCVPFGFFANVFTAEWGKESNIVLQDYRPVVRIDMDALHHIVNNIKEIPSVKNNIKYFFNNTAYNVANKIRYNEIYFEGDNMRYKLSAVEENPILISLMNFTKTGKTIQEIVLFFQELEEGYEAKDIRDFIYDLIDEQILQSDFRVNITGTSPLEKIWQMLRQLNKRISDNSLQEAMAYIEKTANLIALLENAEKNTTFQDRFEELKNHIVKRHPTLDINKMIQVDNYAIPLVSTVNEDLQQTLYESIKILSSLSNRKNNPPRLEEFKKDFIARYDTAVVSLMEVIDTEAGISFGGFNHISDNLFIEGIAIEGTSESENTPSLNKVEAVLYKKYLACLKEGKTCIVLEEEDLKHFPPGKVEQMATTCQVLFNFVDKHTNTVSLKTTGHASGASLIARFAHGSKEIHDSLLEIVEYEKQRYPSAIVAEIVHIPENRMGNVTFRPEIRDFEIPIITNLGDSKIRKISLDDLYITVRNDRIILLSKKYKKEVFPKLTNAHNYGLNTLPIYQFLSELSYQGIIPSLELGGHAIYEFVEKYMPKIQYKNVILSPAFWRFKKEDLKDLIQERNSLNLEIVEKFRHKWHIPIYTLFAENGNKKTLIKWDEINSVINFLNGLKNHDEILLYEYLFDEQNALIKDTKENLYANEIIAVFKNNKRQNSTFSPPSHYFNNEKRNFFPSEEWLYLKVYCGLKSYDILTPNIKPQSGYT